MKKIFALLLLSSALVHAQPVATSTNSFAWDSLEPLVNVERFEIVLFDGQSRQVNAASALTTELPCLKLMGSSANGIYSLLGYTVGKDGQRSEASTNFVFRWQGVSIAPDVVIVPLSIVTQPIAQSVKVGQQWSLTVVATGSNLSFQWCQNGFPLSGATQPTLAIPSAQVKDSGSYTCRIADAMTFLFSTPVNVTVKGPINPPVNWKIK